MRAPEASGGPLEGSRPCSATPSGVHGVQWGLRVLKPMVMMVMLHALHRPPSGTVKLQQQPQPLLVPISLPSPWGPVGVAGRTGSTLRRGCTKQLLVMAMASPQLLVMLCLLTRPCAQWVPKPCLRVRLCLRLLAPTARGWRPWRPPTPSPTLSTAHSLLQVHHLRQPSGRRSCRPCDGEQ